MTRSPAPSFQLGAYAAKTCREALTKRYSPVYANAYRDPVPEATQMRFDDGNAFEQSIGQSWQQQLGKQFVALPADTDTESGAARQQQTTELMNRTDVTVIWNPRLPADETGHRRGEPDALVFAGVEDGVPRWHPVDVKNHTSTQRRTGHTMWASPLDRPQWQEAEVFQQGRYPRWDDGVQLAHYHRMLQAAGHAAAEPKGGIVGREQVVMWHDLDHVGWRSSLYDGARSTLENYDAHFTEATDAVRAAVNGQTVTRPQLNSDCAECVFRTVCRDEMSAADEVTLVAGVTPARARVLREHGITTVTQLAAAHADDLPDGTWVRQAIDQARVVKAGKVHRARGVDQVAFTPVQVEQDFDIEDYHGFVYLVGVRTTRRRTVGRSTTVASEFTPFVTWDSTSEAEAAVFAQFWAFVTGTQTAADSTGEGYRAYHYSHHERSTFIRLATTHAGAPGVPTVEQVEAWFASDVVVDLRQVVTGDLLWPTENYSLKALAKWVRFSWRDTDPSGGNSMAWYVNATNPSLPDVERRQWQERIVDYNEDDCAAQTAIRDWLSSLGSAWSPGTKVPAVETLEQRFGSR